MDRRSIACTFTILSIYGITNFVDSYITCISIGVLGRMGIDVSWFVTRIEPIIAKNLALGLTILNIYGWITYLVYLACVYVLMRIGRRDKVRFIDMFRNKRTMPALLLPAALHCVGALVTMFTMGLI